MTENKADLVDPDGDLSVPGPAEQIELLDPNGGPQDEDDPDIYPDPTADDPPFADRELWWDDDE